MNLIQKLKERYSKEENSVDIFILIICVTFMMLFYLFRI